MSNETASNGGRVSLRDLHEALREFRSEQSRQTGALWQAVDGLRDDIANLRVEDARQEGRQAVMQWAMPLLISLMIGLATIVTTLNVSGG